MEEILNRSLSYGVHRSMLRPITSSRNSLYTRKHCRDIRREPALFG